MIEASNYSKVSVSDNACLTWGNICGERTNCLLYDTDSMRTTLCYFVASCLALATLADVGVWWYSKNIDLWGDNKKTETKEEDNVIEMKHAK